MPRGEGRGVILRHRSGRSGSMPGPRPLHLTSYPSAFPLLFRLFASFVPAPYGARWKIERPPFESKNRKLSSRLEGFALKPSTLRYSKDIVPKTFDPSLPSFLQMGKANLFKKISDLRLAF